ncbi:bifunctional 5,10-methylenetetrahydrofolate dehydrogenase/5,10-methenyltetrahydrofolate cyclohydrolase [Candidatus Uhrbacteria bacterium]|nr:bifunctional 5,10-methylenetetrahydrofolate dehydrogenase/5,10-methenyltetrahydrofolate cyclohydrolase [Candidatus Uhrbacteria bacterium]
MPAKILDGRTLGATIRNQIKEEVKKLGFQPGLAVLLVGNDPASRLYVSLKQKACQEVGIRFELHEFPELPSEDKLIALIQKLNQLADVQAILVQLPLPWPLSEERLVRAIDPKKDADGFHPKNLEAIRNQIPAIIPGVIMGIMTLIEAADRPLVRGQAILLVNSKTFALPLEYLLKQRGLSVQTLVAPADLPPSLAAADIIVVALGRAHCLNASLIKPGAVIIDVGTNRLSDGRVVGDVDAASVKEKAGALSPVPGGVGPLTVAMLLKNVLLLSQSNPSG